MRRLLFIIPLLALPACKKDEVSSSPPPREISYSREVRPLLISNCLQCHADLPLHNPTRWNLLHPHPEQDVPGLLREWVRAGSKIDQHWALAPLKKIPIADIDDFTEIGGNAISNPRKAPAPLFSEPVEQVLAGDLLSDPDSAIATRYFRQGPDTPASRTTLVTRQFLGLRFECAQCHDHPHEPVTTKDYQRLIDLFTTPCDDQRLPSGIRPPLHVKMEGSAQTQHVELQARLAALLTAPVVDPKDYHEWLSNEGNLPEISDLIASYGFENRQLTNLAPNSPVKEGGVDLIAENGVHGQGLLFDGKNHLSLENHGIENESSPFALSLWIKLSPEALAETSLVQMGSPDRGFEVRIVSSRIQVRWSRAWPENAIATTSNIPLLAPYRWGHLVVSSDGNRNAKGLRIFFNGRPVDPDFSSGQLLFKSVLNSQQPITIQGAGAMIDELQIFRKALTAIEASQLFDGKSLAQAFAIKDDLGEFYTQKILQQDLSRATRITEIQQQLLALENALPEYPVLRHRPVTTPNSKDESRSIFTSTDRLQFVRSLNRNLLARSLANEVWRAHFGAPLAYDLGHGSLLPRHPDLLEWLAGKLVEFQYNPDTLAALIQDSNLWLREWTGNDDSRIKCPRVE